MIGTLYSVWLQPCCVELPFSIPCNVYLRCMSVFPQVQGIAPICTFAKHRQTAVFCGCTGHAGFGTQQTRARTLLMYRRHEGLDVKTLITFGGQHQGIVNLPGCQVTSNAAPGYVCQVSRTLNACFASGFPEICKKIL